MLLLHIHDAEYASVSNLQGQRTPFDGLDHWIWIAEFRQEIYVIGYVAEKEWLSVHKVLYLAKKSSIASDGKGQLIDFLLPLLYNRSRFLN